MLHTMFVKIGPPVLEKKIFEGFFSSPEPKAHIYSWSGVRLSSSVVVNNFKHLLLQNRLPNQRQILCGASLGRGNESLFAASSRDQVAATPIYGKNPSKNFLQNRQADFHETWYVASGTPS